MRDQRIRDQRTDQKAVVLGVAIVIALFIGGVTAVAMLSKSSKKVDAPVTSTVQQTSTTASNPTPAPSTTAAVPAVTTPPTAPVVPATNPVSAPVAQPVVEKELTIPPTIAQIKAFFPDGITTVRYWYENMDSKAGYEVVVAYSKDKQARLAVLAGTEPLYHLLWDAELPGQTITSLTVGDRNNDDVTEIAVYTAQSSTSGYMNLVQYSDAGPVVLLLKGGEHDGQNTKISYTTTTETLSTTGIYRVDLGDKNANGKVEIDILTGPAVGDTAGVFQVYQDMYEWDGAQYTFISQSLVNPTPVAE